MKKRRPGGSYEKQVTTAPAGPFAAGVAATSRQGGGS